MKFHLLFSALISFFLVLIFSCNKYEEEKKILSGTYPCSVHCYTYSNFSSDKYDSTYYEVVEIKQDGQSLTIFGNNIPIDSLNKEQVYFQGDHHYSTTVQFRNDSIFIRRYSGGLGGGCTWDYTGAKL